MYRERKNPPNVYLCAGLSVRVEATIQIQGHGHPCGLQGCIQHGARHPYAPEHADELK